MESMAPPPSAQAAGRTYGRGDDSVALNRKILGGEPRSPRQGPPAANVGGRGNTPV
jgi:hypothetical protein